jgi:hypothetical protein
LGLIALPCMVLFAQVRILCETTTARPTDLFCQDTVIAIP